MRRFPLAWRSLRRAPAFTTAVILTIAIGLGAATAIFAVLNAVLIKPLPYPDADRLFGAWLDLPGLHYDNAAQSLATYFATKRLAHSIDGIAVFDRGAVNVADPASDLPAERLSAAEVSASALSLLGATFEVGREFTESEDTPRGEPVVILSNGLWRRRFGANPAIVGKKIQVDGQLREIVGVASASFHFPDAGTELWIPLALDPHAPYGGAFGHQAFIKLRRGVTPEAAQADLNQILPRAAIMFPELFAGMSTADFLAQSRAHAFVRPMRDDVVGSIGGVLWIAAAAGILILLTACANVASLLVARTDARQREFNVRAALGANALRLAAPLFAESALFASIGAACGLALASAALAMLRREGPAGFPRLSEIHVDATVILLTFALACAVMMFCAMVTLVRLPVGARVPSLAEGERGGTVGRTKQRVRRALVVAQVAFAVVLVGGTVLLLRSIDRLRDVRPGFDPDHSLVLWLSLPQVTYPTDKEVLEFTDRLLAGVSSLPGVRAAGISSKVPLDRLGSTYSPVWADNDRTSAGALPQAEQLTTATGGYFDAMRIPLLAGRTFGRIGRETPFEVIVDQKLAAQYWNDASGQHALGRRLRFTQPDGPWYTVVGVVGNVRDSSLAALPSGQVYLPDATVPDTTFAQVTRVLAVVVRTDASSRPPTTALLAAVRNLDRGLPAFNIHVMADVVAQSMARMSFVMTILAVAASVALTLAGIGLYGVIAYLVNLRTKEIGVRIALGAAPAGVARLVTNQGAVLAAWGVGCGVAMFMLASRFLRSMLFGIGVLDPLTVIAMSGVLMAVAVVASWLPARRASRIDPVRALGTGEG